MRIAHPFSFSQTFPIALRKEETFAGPVPYRDGRRGDIVPALPFSIDVLFFIANHNTLGRPSVRIAALLFLRPSPYFDGLGTPAGGRETRSPFHPFLPSIAILRGLGIPAGGRNAPCVRPPFFLSKICFIHVIGNLCYLNLPPRPPFVRIVAAFF